MRILKPLVQGMQHDPGLVEIAALAARGGVGDEHNTADGDGVDPDGRSFNEQNLFATIFRALGIDPYAEFDLPGFPTFHRVEEKAEPISEILA